MKKINATFNCRDSIDAGTPRRGLPGTHNKPEEHTARCGLLCLPKVLIVMLASVLVPACLHGGGEPQIGEITCDGSPHLSCKRDQIKMRDYMDRWDTPPEQVTSPTWSPPLPCKQAVSAILLLAHGRRKSINDIFSCGSRRP